MVIGLSLVFSPITMAERMGWFASERAETMLDASICAWFLGARTIGTHHFVLHHGFKPIFLQQENRTG
jgi:hypothetical protein